MKNVKRVFVLLLLAIVVLSLVACNNEGKTFQFKYWNDCEALNTLTTYVTAVTDEKSADYIPEKDRIAVFDMDGTLVC